MRKTSSHPSISVVIATYNSERTIGRCLANVRNQIYPQDKIEIIICDGGSTDSTRQIAKQYKTQIISIDKRLQNAEYNKSIGLTKAKGEIFFLLDHDNIIPHRLWLKKMVQPFVDNPEVVGVETLRYRYDKHTTLIDRYFALFGAGDPIAWYLGKADRLSYLFEIYNLWGEAKDKGDYYLVKFSPKKIPTLGANGFLIRTKLLRDEAESRPGKFFHIDVNVDLIRKGFNTYAFVKDDILHLTGYGSVWYFLKRRMLFIEQFHLSKQNLSLQKNRRYSVVESKDLWGVVFFIIISLTVVVPLWDSIKGWLKVRDSAWFLHPVLCFSFVVIYGWVIMRHQIGVYAKKLLDS